MKVSKSLPPPNMAKLNQNAHLSKMIKKMLTYGMSDQHSKGPIYFLLFLLQSPLVLKCRKTRVFLSLTEVCLFREHETLPFLSARRKNNQHTWSAALQSYTSLYTLRGFLYACTLFSVYFVCITDAPIHRM